LNLPTANSPARASYAAVSSKPTRTSPPATCARGRDLLAAFRRRNSRHRDAAGDSDYTLRRKVEAHLPGQGRRDLDPSFQPADAGTHSPLPQLALTDF